MSARIQEEKQASEIVDHKCSDSHDKTMVGKDDKNDTEPEMKGCLEGLKAFDDYFEIVSEEDTDGEVKEEIEEIQQTFATTKVDDPAFISGLNPKMKKAEHPQLYADKVNRTQEVLVRKTFLEWYDLDFDSAWVSQAQRGTVNQSKFQWYPDSAKQAKELKDFTPYPMMVKDEEVSPLGEYANIANKIQQDVKFANALNPIRCLLSLTEEQLVLLKAPEMKQFAKNSRADETFAIIVKEYRPTEEEGPDRMANDWIGWTDDVLETVLVQGDKCKMLKPTMDLVVLVGRIVSCIILAYGKQAGKEVFLALGKGMEPIIWNTRKLLLDEDKKVVVILPHGHATHVKRKGSKGILIPMKKQKAEENKMEEKKNDEEEETGEGCKCKSVPAGIAIAHHSLTFTPAVSGGKDDMDQEGTGMEPHVSEEEECKKLGKQ